MVSEGGVQRAACGRSEFRCPGVCYLLRNDPIRAESAFSAVHVGAQASANGSAGNPAVASNLGAALLRQARYKEAIADFERALRLDPGEPDYEFNEGLGKYLTGDWPAASEALREALRLEPNDAQIKALLIASLDHPATRTKPALFARRRPSGSGHKSRQRNYAAAPRYGQARSHFLGALGASADRFQPGSGSSESIRWMYEPLSRAVFSEWPRALSCCDAFGYSAWPQ